MARNNSIKSAATGVICATFTEERDMNEIRPLSANEGIKTRSDFLRGTIAEGLTIPETATTLEISSRTVDREWKFAKAWLERELCG